MIPIRLRITGFLSYDKTAELDFTSFDLACISGANGAGKSSLLDAMTWALFGQARRRDDTLINSHTKTKAAEVVFEFSYENNVYRIQRTKPRDKSAVLEFQVRDGDGQWRALTEKSVRDTELRIQRTLRLDYETFTNASFFLQGKADQFAQQRPGDRKRILSSILGLEVWETYRDAAANRRKALEIEMGALDSRLGEINAELGEEGPRRARLKELETSLAQLSRLRQAGEANLESLRRLEASLGEQQRMVEMLAGQLQATRRRLDQQAQQVAARRQERAAFQEQLANEGEIKAAYAAWQAARQELEGWEQAAANFRQVESRRAAPLMAIEKERSALEQEQIQLLEREQQAAALQDQKTGLEEELRSAGAAQARVRIEYQNWQQARQELERWEKIAGNFRQFEAQRAGPLMALERERATLQQEQNSLAGQRRQAEELEIQKVAIVRDLQGSHAALEVLQGRLERRPQLEAEQVDLLDQRTAARAENEHLKPAMNELKDRIDRLRQAEGAVCPVCGQPLSAADRDRLVKSLETEGRAQGDRYRANQEFTHTIESRLKELNNDLDGLRTLEKTEYQAQNRRAAGLEERISQIEGAQSAWKAGGALRLLEVERVLAQEDFAAPQRQELAQIDGRMKELGYDSQAHEAARGAEQEGRASAEQLQDISGQLAGLEERLKQAAAGLEAWQASGAPHLAELQRILGQEDFAAPARQELAQVDLKLKELGYDAAAHDAARRCEQEGRASEGLLRQLENARAALAPLAREISALEAQYRQEEAEAQSQERTWQQADQKYRAERAALPDIEQAERELDDLREQENIQSMQVGAARQQVEVLKVLKTRQKELNTRRAAAAMQITRYKQLERAFSKDGVPALLIEQALPDIVDHANNILERLSGGGMSVSFDTQREYKDKNRDDKKETLDILITDESGKRREYELFSGGEAFRINFAIRLALSRVLAQRAGARLQMLVIDEGFGSQDAEGRQRLIEAINLVRPDFAKVLVITHLEELKDAFPARIEVEKTPEGSQIRVI
jgi:exonuclease SbcC